MLTKMTIIITHSEQAQLTQILFSPKSANSTYPPSPGISIYCKVILYVKWLKHKLSSRLKSFSFSKINLEKTICNTEDWFFFSFEVWMKVFYTLTHSPALKKKLHTPSWKRTFLLRGGEILVWVKKGIYS